MNTPMLKCVFREGNNTKIRVRTSSHDNAKTVGLLESYNCIGYTFYCEYDRRRCDETGRTSIESGYYKLVCPKKYDVNTTEPAYVDLIQAISTGVVIHTEIVYNMTPELIPSVYI